MSPTYRETRYLADLGVGMVKKTLFGVTIVMTILVAVSSIAYAQEVESGGGSITAYMEQVAPADGFTVSTTHAPAIYNPPEDKGRSGRWSMIMTTSLIDTITTSRALGMEGAREANPILAPLAKNKVAFTATKIGLSAYTAHKLDELAEYHPKRAMAISVAISFVQAYVAWNNNKIHQQNMRMGRK